MKHLEEDGGGGRQDAGVGRQQVQQAVPHCRDEPAGQQPWGKSV